MKYNFYNYSNIDIEGKPSYWYDAQYQSTEYASETLIDPLVNDDPLPCEGCPLIKECTVSVKECVAFRKWTDSGKSQKDSDRGRYLR